MKDFWPKHPLRVYLTGFFMGMADLVPGISGGTVALLGGIYGRLINAISACGPTTVKDILQGRWQKAFNDIDLGFLIVLFAGIGSALLGVAKIIHYLLETQPVMMWSLFLGLVVSAGVLLLRELQRQQMLSIAFVASGFIVSALLAQLPVQSAWENVTGWQYLGVMAAGAIAISAMILPGISGSFILLLLGVYPLIIAATATLQIPILAVFALGCLIGITSFSRVVSWLLQNYAGATMSVLTGLMLGSTLKLWPWKYTLSYRINSSGEQVPLLQENMLPWEYSSMTGIDHELAIAIIAVLVAAALVWRFGQIKLKDLHS